MKKTIKMAVIGTGGFGQSHIAGINESDGVELAAICDVNEEIVIEQSKKFGVPYYTDYKELLKDENIDAVSVATPDFLHCEIVEDALRAGKHVLCEKPLALNLDHCKRMISAAKKYDKIFMVGQICRYTPSFAKAKQLCDNGEIGDIYFMESEYAHDYSGMPADSWRRRPDRHGLVGGGCHAVDLIRWFVGDPEEVFGYSNHMMLPEWPTADCTVGIMKFKSGAIGKVFCSTGCKRNYTMRTVIYGTKGTIIMDNTTPSITLFKERCEGHQYDFTNSINIPVPVANHNIKNEVSDFISLVTGGGTAIVNAEQGASTVSVCVSIIKSCESGQPEKVDYNF